MSDWGHPDVQKWKEEARSQQQSYNELLGDREWDVIDKGEWTILRQKVGFGIYNAPPAEPTKENKYTGYNEKQLAHIEKICDKLSEHNDGVSRADTYFACIFVTGKMWDDRFTVPIFKTKQMKESTTYFVDTDGRVYSSWDDYLNHNKLPKCMYCYPRDGTYSGEDDNNNKVKVDFGTSPACDLVNRIFSWVDTAATVVTLGATAVGIAALCTVPIAGPIAAGTAIAGATSGVYAAGRSTYTLIDRGTHDQSVGLTDKESLACWLSIVGSTLGLAQGQMLSSMANSARAGEVMGKAGRIAFVVVNTGCLTVNGIGIVHGLAILVDKSERNELTALDVFQFSASVLFFTNSVVNFKTAGTIIKEVQRDTIGQVRDGLTPDAKKLFNKHTGKLRGPDEMHGNARVIKTLNRIDNTQQLYEMMVHRDIDNKKVKLFPDGYRGLLNVNREFKVHPMKFMEMLPETRQSILNATKQLSTNQISPENFKKDMAKICKDNRIRFECMRKETVENLCKAFGKDNVKDIVVNNKRLFANMEPREIDRLSVVLANTGKNYDPRILEVATKFAEMRNCKNINDFCSFMEYSSIEIAKMKKTFEMNYKQKLEVAEKSRNFNRAQFDKEYGIQGKRAAYFEQEALKQFQDSATMTKMNQEFESWKATVSEANSRAKPGFFSNDAATYHYLKHRDFGPKGELSVEGYFQIAADLVGTPTNKQNAMLSQEGTCTFITYKNPANGAFGVKIDRIQDGNTISGIATVMYVRDL